jgi:glycosyltransferase involved in cell wall biosynthesis
MAIKISAVMITLNEERVIENTLKSLDWCDEMLVVDSGSTDKTVEICKQYGCLVLYKKFEGYGEQKKYAVHQAQNDWVLVIDADEIVTFQLKTEIQTLLQKENLEESGFKIPRDMIFMQHKMRFGGLSGEMLLRMFDKKRGNFNANRVHEDVELTGKIGKLKGRILHESYEDIHDYFQRFNHYTTLGAEEALKKGKKKAVWYLYVRFPFSFLQLFIFRGLILDGLPGFLWAMFSAMYPVVKYAKLYEKLKNK